MLRWFKPDLRLACVEQLDIGLLRHLEIDALLLDVDCTLTQYGSETVPEAIVAWVDSLRGEGVGLCLVSNGRGPRIETVAGRLGVPFVAPALKPLPRGCRAALVQTGFDRRRTAMVGDQVFADVMAGRLAGLFTVLVDPIHPELEPWYTRLKRPLEKLLVRRVAHGQSPCLDPSA
ncbi:MAG: YqeG family HAD IIIA-type phosphatase [Pirellulales bacterium]|nr:YqeG family HAD IIIA-type phosphatase [Pirellulales bacterium]